jgi:hypothetical protein
MGLKINEKEKTKGHDILNGKTCFIFKFDMNDETTELVININISI